MGGAKAVSAMGPAGRDGRKDRDFSCVVLKERRSLRAWLKIASVLKSKRSIGVSAMRALSCEGIVGEVRQVGGNDTDREPVPRGAETGLARAG
jgi:hypothetical protein